MQQQYLSALQVGKVSNNFIQYLQHIVLCESIYAYMDRKMKLIYLYEHNKHI